MEALTDIGTWISENESLLSGIAAMIVVAGVVFTPLGAGLRSFLGRRADNVGAGPSEIETATADENPQAVAPATTAPSDRPSIAVLPFMNMSDDPEQEFLADGMTEDIITGLAATRHLYVVSRNSTFAYKGQSPDIRDVGRELGARYVLEGSVRRVGENVRTTCQLIDAADGNHLWAEKYDRPYTEIFDTQDEVVSDIAGALSIQLTAAEVARIRRAPPANLGAWEFLAQAMWGHTRGSPSIAASQKNLALLKSAVELEPNYPYSRAAYAWALFSASINGFVPDPMVTAREGQEQLQAALELDTTDPLTLYYIGAAYVYAGRHDKGIRFLERSLATNPHQPEAMAHLALAWAYVGEFPRSYVMFDQADRMVSAGLSSYFSWYRGIALGLEGRYEEAIPIVAAVLEQIPRYGAARVNLALAYEAIGQPDKAQSEILRAAELDPGLCVDGIAMLVRAHPDPEEGNRREASLRRYWPTG